MNARIKIGSTVWMNFRVWTWPDLPKTTSEPINPSMEFEVTEFALKLDKSGWRELRAPGFGAVPYGNGSIYVEDKYLE